MGKVDSQINWESSSTRTINIGGQVVNVEIHTDSLTIIEWDVTISRSELDELIALLPSGLEYRSNVDTQVLGSNESIELDSPI